MFALPLLLAVPLGACQTKNEVVVFHAASLSRAFGELRESFLSKYPDTRVRIEVSGSQTAARKVAELGMRADVVASADASVLDHILAPAWNLHFATNELVLTHRGHSRYTGEVTAENWPEVLVRPDVVVGLVDPDLAPIGYRTLMLWQLAGHDLGVADLASTLHARIAREHVMPDENKLLALLSSRAIDYAFMYRSTAEEHHLKVTRLSDATNLGRAEVDYGRATVRVRMRHAREPIELRGAPVIYGLTIPSSAPNPAGGELFVLSLLEEKGRRILARTGFRPLVHCDNPSALPARLQALVP